MTNSADPTAFFAPDVPRAELKRLARRKDSHGLIRFALWGAGCGASGAWVIFAYGTPWVSVALPVHGILLSFSYAISHECAHGTAFRSRRLNETVFWLSSLIFGEEPVYRRYAHASHHSLTWHRGKDHQMPYSNPVSLRTYLSETAGLVFFWQNAKRLASHSCGRFGAEIEEIVPASERPGMRRNSIIFLLIYSGLLAATLLTYLPLLLYFLPRIIGSPIVNLYINTQHMGMQEDVPDHRHSTRSIRCSAPGRWLYWNMNYHVEHHLFPMVPFFALPSLSATIESELPKCSEGVLAANRSILKLIRKQKHDPHAVALPELPAASPGQAWENGP